MEVLEALGLSALFAYLCAVIFVVGEGGAPEQTHSCRFECPFLREPVECRVVQDARSRRWLYVAACTAYPIGAPACAQDCVVVLNDRPAMRGALAGTGAVPSA